MARSSRQAAAARARRTFKIERYEMEREKELLKLVNVLRQTARTAMHSELTNDDKGAARFCMDKYNRVLARLKQIDESVSAVFEPLAADSSLNVTAMACR